MRRLIFAALALAAMSSAAAADPMQTAYGNTVVVTYPDGAQVKLLIEADGTYSATSPQGPAKGTWAIAGDQTCFTQTDPAPPAGMGPSCAPTVEKNVGDVWDGVGLGGAPVKVTITAGR